MLASQRLSVSKTVSKIFIPLYLFHVNYYRAKKQRRLVKSLSRVRLFATLWTVAYQASPSMGFSRQEYWSGLPFPSPEDQWTKEKHLVSEICCMHAKLCQSCLTLYNPMDSSPPGSSVSGFSRQEYWSGLPFPSPKWNTLGLDFFKNSNYWEIFFKKIS